ncbi:MAG: hypothetical protein U0163_10905 [Gemmatimonadaceae bacterium]
MFYVPTNNLCMDYKASGSLLRRLHIGADAPREGAGPGDYKGEFIAWDASTGKKIWGIKEPFPVWGGVLATAGNVVLYGTLDGLVRCCRCNNRRGVVAVQG